MRSGSNGTLPQREWGRFGVLLVALVAFLVVLPFFPGSGAGGALLRLGWSVVILAGLLTASRNRKALWIALVIAIPVLVLRWTADHSDLPALRIAEPLSSALFLAFTAGVILKSIFFERRVTLDEILGGVIVYLLIGVVWGQLHHALELAHPGAYLLGDVALVATASGADENPVLTFLYYSFTTLTTLGYGDIRPVTHAARMLSTSEALIGQLYVAILIARLVGSHISQRGDS
jgi:voltage-gated potassium channel Kch